MITTVHVLDDELRTLIITRAHTIANAIGCNAARSVVIEYAERLLRLAEELPPDPPPQNQPQAPDISGLTKQ